MRNIYHLKDLAQKRTLLSLFCKYDMIYGLLVTVLSLTPSRQIESPLFVAVSYITPQLDSLVSMIF